MAALSCTSPTFCAAVDSQGLAFTYNGTGWSRTASVEAKPPSQFNSYSMTGLSCASPTFCVAVADGLDARIFDGQKWTTDSTALPITGGVGSLSCPASTFCLAVQSRHYSTYDGAGWTHNSIPDEYNGDPHLTSGSCGNDHFCVIVDDAGNAKIWNGATWRDEPAVSQTGLTHVACDASQCVAVDAHDAYVFDGTSWSGPTVVNAATDAEISAIACTSAADCVAVTRAGQTFVEDATGWRQAGSITADGNIDELSCTTATNCVAMASAGDATVFDGQVWSAPVGFDRATGGLTAVSCPNTTACTAVDENGNVLRKRIGVWGAPVSVDPHLAFRDLSCPETDLCVAEGWRYDAGTNLGVLTVLRGNTAVSVAGPILWNAIACAASNLCLAVSIDGQYSRFDGSTWSAPKSSGFVSFSSSLSCGSRTMCTDGQHVFDGTSWRFADTRRKGAPPSGDISCAGSTYCAAVYGLFMTEYDGTAWDMSASRNGGAGEHISCPDAHFCVTAVYPSGTRTFIDGLPVFVPVPGTTGEEPGWDVTDLTCPSVHTCTAVDDTSAIAWQTGVTAPAITVQPVSVRAPAGAFAALKTQATGTPAPTVQWQESSTPNGPWHLYQDRSVPTINIRAVASPAYYRAVFTNHLGNAATRAVSVSTPPRPVLNTAPRVTQQPRNVKVRTGRVAVFRARASGTPAPTTRWQRSTDRGKHWKAITRATSATLRVKATKRVRGYRYRAVFTNVAGHVLSQTATLRLR